MPEGAVVCSKAKVDVYAQSPAAYCNPRSQHGTANSVDMWESTGSYHSISKGFVAGKPLTQARAFSGWVPLSGRSRGISSKV